jgi:putative hydrolase of the HAD superfamily
MKRLTHVFFDLDHTLWDFDKNSSETLEFLFHKHNFNSFHNIALQQFITEYHKVNRELWELFNHNKIDKHQLRELRLQYTFVNLGIDPQHIPTTFNEEYISLCPHKGHLFPHAIEILEHLQCNYNLHILSNGFAEIQAIKIHTSGIEPYFSNIFTADHIGVKKPNKAFFEFVLNKLNTVPDNCIMIGDTLDADVLGAMNAGIKGVYFNPSKTMHQENIDFEITSLIQLKDFL